MLFLRQADVSDAPAIYAIADDYKGVHLDDYSCISPDLILEILHQGIAYAVVDEENYPVGFVAFEPHPSRLHAALHCIVRPQYLKDLLREKTTHAILSLAFDTLAFSHITAKTLEGQTAAHKLLLMHGFKWVGLLPNETTVGGVKKDMYFFSLKSNYWKKGLDMGALPSKLGDIKKQSKFNGLLWAKSKKRAA